MAHIGIVDDSKMIRNLTSLLLKSGGHTCIDYEYAQEVLDVPVKVDIFLCDVCMPGLSGTDFLNALRKKKDLTPVILMSAEITDEVLDTVAKNKKAMLLEKSKLRGELLKTVETMLK
jgi:FixJ family two-component response regulator